MENDKLARELRAAAEFLENHCNFTVTAKDIRLAADRLEALSQVMENSDVINKELAEWIRIVAATQADGGHDSQLFEMIAQRLETLSQVTEAEVEGALEAWRECQSDDVHEVMRAALKAARKART